MTSESFNGTNTNSKLGKERVLKNHWRYHKYHVIQQVDNERKVN